MKEPLEVRPQEQLLIAALRDLPGGRLLCNTAGRGQLAADFARRDAANYSACWLLDLYQQRECRRAQAPPAGNLDFFCAADAPAEAFDLVAWAFSQRGDGELTREMLQIGRERLRPGGRLVCASDNPRDQWLHEQLRAAFPKVTRRPDERGVVYLTTSAAPRKKQKNHACEFTFLDGEREIRLRTRPGVFSHRELDGGARALVKSLGDCAAKRILDIGCGSGAVGLAAALRTDEAHVHAIDSNPRAIEAARWAAEHNRLEGRLTAALDDDGSSVAPGAFDLAVANPPYYSNFRLAELFLRIAGRSLVSGGRLLLVTKSPEWYLQRWPDYFPRTELPAAIRQGGYWVLAGTTAR